MEMSAVLPNDLWRYIAFKLDSAGDRIRLRAVSKSWRSLLPFRHPPWLVLSEVDVNQHKDPTPPPNHGGLFSKSWKSLLPFRHPPWLVLSEDPTPPPRGFVCLSDQTIHKIDFPQIHQARVVGSTGNWLITMHLGGALRMSNPFARLQICLPSPWTFENGYEDDEKVGTPEDYRDVLVWKVVLSSPPLVDGTGDWVALAIHHHGYYLAIARPNDSSWIQLKGSSSTMDVISYEQRIYAITREGVLMACELESGLDPPILSPLTNPFPKLLECTPHFDEGYLNRNHYLVECSGEIIQVIRVLENFYSPYNYKTNRFEVYKLDFTNMKFNETKSLGEHSLFLGANKSISLRASDYHGLVKKNCIYYTDDYSLGFIGMCILGGRDMGVFDLEEGTIKPIYKDISPSLYSPQVWMVPA